MKELVIDIGNTFVKVGEFTGRERMEAHRLTPDQASDYFRNMPDDIENIIVSDVGNYLEGIPLKYNGSLIRFSHRMKLPVRTLYKAPETLGVDRLAGVCGAALAFPGESALVIDAGSCITYDFIDEKAVHQGGQISPGLSMRLRAMNAFTSRLPAVSEPEYTDFCAVSTAEGMASGTVEGVVGEIEHFVSLYRERFGTFRIILTGGATDFLCKRLKNRIFASPEFVMDSLYRILQYTKDNA